MKIVFSNKAAKTLSKLDTITKQRIKKAVVLLPNGDVKFLQGRISTWRLRVGGWRILFSRPNDDTIFIEKIAPRGQAYKEG